MDERARRHWQAAGGMLCLLLAAAAGAAEVEVLHWWTSGGEARSAAELKQMLESKGHRWKDFVVAGGGGGNAMDLLRVRAVSGRAPAAAQIKGPAIQEWGEQGVLASIDPVARAGNWDRLLPPVVSQVMKYKGSYVAAPVNVHRVNWMWINTEVFRKADAPIPATWEEFFVAADKIRRAGFLPLAHGTQPWQDFTLFESVVLGVGGPGFYRAALVERDPAALKSPTMESALNTYKAVRRYIDKDAANREWNQATAMVIRGQAAMQFMGDWAKGEFTAAGKKPGLDYLCLPAPGTANAFTFNIDSFVMFKQRSPEAQQAQADLAAAVMSPEFQEIFNLNKGSIPARLNMNMSRFDDCARRSSNDFIASAQSGGLVPSIAHYMAVPTAAADAMRNVVARFSSSDTMTAAQAMTLLATAARVR